MRPGLSLVKTPTQRSGVRLFDKPVGQERVGEVLGPAPAKIVKEGQVFTGDMELTVKNGKLLVEEVTVAEEPALEGKAKVVYRGEIRFNYPVEPETLAPLVKLIDPEAQKPIEVKLETDYRESSATARSPSRRKGDERVAQAIPR